MTETGARPRAAFFGGQGIYGRQSQVDYVYGPERRRRIGEWTELYPEDVHWGHLHLLEQMGDLQVIFCTWGMPVLDAAALDLLPKLEAVFYAAGTVKPFAEPLLDRAFS